MNAASVDFHDLGAPVIVSQDLGVVTAQAAETVGAPLTHSHAVTVAPALNDELITGFSHVEFGAVQIAGADQAAKCISRKTTAALAGDYLDQVH